MTGAKVCANNFSTPKKIGTHLLDMFWVIWGSLIQIDVKKKKK